MKFGSNGRVRRLAQEIYEARALLMRYAVARTLDTQGDPDGGRSDGE